jgi:hypothetical protein
VQSNRTHITLLALVIGLWIAWALYAAWAILRDDDHPLSVTAYVAYALLQALAWAMTRRGWTRSSLALLLALLLIPFLTFFQPLVTIPTTLLVLAAVLVTDRHDWNRILPAAH